MEKPRAVIVAAGRGTRLHPYTAEIPKCLLEIEAGTALLDFTLEQLRELGIDEIIVATRPEYVESIRKQVGEAVKIVAVNAEDYGNLYTFYVASAGLGDGLIVAVMSDHLFEREVLRRLVAAGGDKAVILCLDKEPGWREAVEGLRVRESMELVVEAGKKLEHFSGVDTGLFLLNTRGLELVREVVEKIGPSAKFVDLVNYAAARGEAAYVDVTGRLWMDIDTPEDLARARQLYREILRRNLYRPSDGPISTYINRPVSTRISMALWRSAPWLKPNHVTVFSFLLGVAAAALFAFGFLVAGGLMAQFSSIIDGVDGELARLRKEVTRFGGFFDTVLDRFADIAIVLALGISATAFLSTLYAVLIASLAAAGVVIVSYVSIAARGHIDLQRLRGGFPWATRDVRLFTVMVGGILQQPLIPLIYCAATPIIFAVKAFMIFREKMEKAKPRLPEIRPPKPELKPVKRIRRFGKVKENLIALFSNAFKLILTLALVHFASYAFGDVRLPLFITMELKMIHIFGLINLIAIIYFGYKILMVLKFFVEVAADQLVRKLEITGAIYRRIGMDFLYLAAILLTWFAVSPILGGLPEELWVLKTSVTLLIFSFFLIVLYDVARVSYRSLRGVWERFLERVSEALEKQER